MSRLRLFALAPVTLALLGAALSPGCRAATQVTLEISLAKRASCTETNGTAITVGTDPAATEKRVLDEYVNAATSSCDEATGQIGTLVLTPGESGRGSVIVVVSYDRSISPSACKPPLFKGCIVARRQFAFADHAALHLPITIDPNCKDVPCDAFSTCRTGACVPSETRCEGDTCAVPGDADDAGTSEAGRDAQGDGPIASEGGPDSGGDASEGGTSDAGSPLRCENGKLTCPDSVVCQGPALACCAAGGTASCTPGNNCVASATQHCCASTDCPNGKVCNGANATKPGVCGAAGAVSCDSGVIQCAAVLGGTAFSCAPGTTVSCCDTAEGPICGNTPNCPVTKIRYCCSNADCGMQGPCALADPAHPNAPRTCSAPTSL